MRPQPVTREPALVEKGEAKLRSLSTVMARVTPFGVALIVLTASLLFVILRLFLAADGDVTKFLVAGADFTDVRSVPGDIHVFEGQGNDGQFNYRYAMDPTVLGLEQHLGISIDLPLRAGRIGYPALAWVLSFGGSASLLPTVLVLINVLSLTCIGWLGAVIARRSSRAPITGLLLPAWSGFLFSLARDYGDIVGSFAAVAAVVLLQTSRHDSDRSTGMWGPSLAAGLALSFAVLTRELYMVLVFGMIVERAVLAWKSKEYHLIPRDQVWLIPGVIFVSWQIVLFKEFGEIALLSGSGNNQWPFIGIVQSIAHWIVAMAAFPDDLTAAAMAALSAIQFVLLTVFLVSVSRVLKLPGDGSGLTVGWVTLSILLVCISADVWGALNDFRNLSEPVMVGGILLLQCDRSLKVPGSAIGLGSAATVLPRLLRV